MDKLRLNFKINTMKKLAVLFSIFVFVSACKKDRVCECTVVTSGETITTTQIPGLADTSVTIPLNTMDINAITFEETSKKKAKYNCLDKTENINETTSNGIPGLVTINITNKGIRTHSCELK